MLKRVSIQNFKSLKDVTLDLQKVNLLIGPNNSGKTNFLKALEFVSNYANGVKYLNDRTHLKNHEKLVSSFFDDTDNICSQYLYRKALDKTFLIEIYKNHSSNEISYKYEWNMSGNDIDKYINGQVEDVKYGEPTVIPDLIEFFFNFHVYKPDPNKLDKPAPVGRGDEAVTADASNLIAFFDRIRDEHPETFTQIKTDLAKCIPEFTEINFQNVESTEELVKQFGDKTFKRIGLTNGKQKTIYWADELSEGTLYFIALLCIINQPNPPKLLLLEEPEKGIHPRRIYEVIQFIFRLAEDKDIQVIMTTHSPIVLDMFKDMPGSVFIFDKDDEGATHVKNLQRDVIEPDIERSKEYGLEPPRYTDALGDSWTIGFLGGVPK